MARLSFDDNISITLQQLAQMDEDTMDAIVAAGAEVLLEAQREEGEAQGVHRTGVMLESMAVKKVGAGAAEIVFTGKNPSGDRNAVIAAVNNYGKKGQKARPFISDANAKSMDKVAAAEEEVFNAWLNQH